jgi:hypothetical protein
MELAELWKEMARLIEANAIQRNLLFLARRYVAAASQTGNPVAGIDAKKLLDDIDRALAAGEQMTRA